jgi:dTDP-4-dehydrorhamnose 3,5-epimerase
MIKVPLYDARDGSPTKGKVEEFFIGDDNPIAILIPPGVYHGYKTVGMKPSLLLNFPNRLFDRDHPDEFRVPYDSPDVPYSWDIKIR